MQRLLRKKKLALGLMILISSCSGSSLLQQIPRQPSPENPHKIQQVRQGAFPDAEIEEDLAYFLEISLGSEYGVGAFTIKKWVSDVRIEVAGQPTLADLIALEEVVKDLNALVGPNIRLSLVSGSGNLQVHFIPHSEFYHYEPPGIIFYGGFFHSWWNYAGEIYRGLVVIGTDRIDQAHRTHLIREELTQALGLMNDSMKYRDSIFYQGASNVTEFSPRDRKIIRWLYSDGIEPGMTRYQIRERFKNPVLWEKSIVKTYP